MKNSFDKFLLTIGLVLVTASPAFATASVTTLASTNLSADTASSSYLRLTGPVLTEGANRDITATGSITLSAPAGFQFNPSAAVTVTVTRVAGSGTAVVLGSSGAATVTSSSITITVTAIDASGTTRSSLTWSGIQVQPIVGTPLASGNITKSGVSITGITSGSTSFGTLTEVAGPASKLAITQSPATNTAGSSLFPAVQVRVQDAVGNNVGTNNVSITVSLDHGSFDFGGTTDVTGTNGSVVFSTLQINTATNYFLNASAAGFSNATPAALTIVPASPFSIQFIQDAPSSAIISTVFSPPVVVKVADFFGNGINTQTVNMAMIGGGSLSGTTARVTGTSGLATFNDLSTATAGTNENLVASMTSPALSATGATFAVSAGAASKLGFLISPTTTTAGVTMASVKVQVQDIAGNSFATNGVSIMIALNTGSFTSATTNLLTGADGSATFTDLVINVAGAYTLTATAPDTSLTATPTAPFSIVPGPITTFQFTQDAPSSVTAGAIFSPNVTVQLADSFSNPISNKTVSLSLNAGGPLLGTTSRATDGTGVATFNNLSIHVAGTNYALIASVTSPSMSITGSTFVVNTDVPSKLAYTTPPPVTNAPGVTLPTFIVQVQDQFNNNISTSGVPIAVGLNTGNFTSGTSNMNSAADGSATFNDLLLNTAGSYTLTASSAGLTSAARSLVITNGPITVFQITQDAPASTPAGTVFSPPVTVHIADQFNNAITNKTVTLTLNGGGALNGTTSRATDSSGVATFTNLSVNVAGTNYSLTASITSPSMSATGSTFVVTTAAPTKLMYTTLPAATNVAGATMSTFVVWITDAFNNFVATNGVPITIGLNTGAFASGTTNLASATDGSATFTDLVINAASTYTMSATSPGLTTAARLITVVPGPYAITFQQDAPTVNTAGAIFSPPVAVRIADAFNNVLSNTTVTLTLNGGGALNGTTSRATTNTGVATFTNLSVNVIGTNYSLTASVTTPALSATGGTFVVNAAAASKLAFSTAPAATNTAGQTLPTFVVQIRDAFNNNISTSNVPITISLSTGTFASGTPTTNTLADGSATFSDLVITNSGNSTLTASAPGLTSTNTTLTILADVANIIAFVQEPAASMTAGTVFTNTVKIVDQFNNGLSNVTVTLSPNGFATLNGTLTRATAGNGVATFNNLSVNTSGTGYSITATGASLSTTSGTFNVTVGAIHHYLVSASSPQSRGVAFPVTVTAQDIVSNTVPDNSTVVTMSSSSANVTFDLNPQTLSNGTFVVNALDSVTETITITATDTGSKTGTSPSISINAAAGDYRSRQNGNWNTAATWETWDGAAWVVASTPPAGGAGTNITLQSGHLVTNNVAVSLTGTLISQGTLTFSGGSISVGSGGVLLNSGAVTSSVSTLIFNANGTYKHNFTTVVGAVPIATWNSNSTCAVIGYTTFAGNPVGLNQSFYNFAWNCPGQSTAISMGGALANVAGDFTVVSAGTGTLQGANTATLNLTIGGDMNLRGGAFVGSVSGTTNVIKIGGSYSQTGGSFSQGANDVLLNFTGANKSFTQSGGTLTTAKMNFAVTNNASLSLDSALNVGTGQSFTVRANGTLNCGTNIVNGAGAFALNAGGALGIGSADGIAATGTSAGNIQTTTRTFDIGGIYIYNGNVAQNTSNGLPATVRTLIVSNTASTVTLSANVAISNDLTVTSGTLDLGSFTANRITSGGTNTVANGATLKIGGGNTLPSNYATRSYAAGSTIEYSGAAQNVSAQTYGNLTTSGSGQKLLQAGTIAIAGSLTIGSGTTFNAGTNNFSLAGNLTNNGSLYAYGILTQTITFNGASPQSISGASSTAFNKVALNSGSVLNLTGNHTALGLTIGGLPQAGGSWGATGSGAANIDDTHFQGTGTLNVNTESFTLVFLQDAPSSVAAGATFTPLVVVQLSNTILDFVTNRTVTLSLNGGGTLNGTLSQLTDTNGVATFTNLSVNAAGNYTLTATVPSLSVSSTGTTFSVVSATATKLVFSTAPPVTNAPGVTIPTFVVQLQDQFNNNVSTSNVPINILLNTGNFTSGTSNLTSAADGSATFFDLLQNTAGNYTMTASSPGLTSAARSLVVTNGPIAVFQFTQDAPASTSAGTIFSPAVTVHVADAFNNPYTNKTVTLTLNGGATLNGTVSRATSAAGVATYTNLNITVSGTNYALVANITSPTMAVTGSTFVVTTSAATKLIYSTLPVATNVAGSTLPTFVVQMQDAFNNNVASGGVPITMTLNTNSFANGTINLTTDVDGSATFFDLVITAAGNYTMSATSPGLTNANRSITILPGTYAMTFQQDAPSTTTAGTIFTPPVAVKVADPYNNGLSNATVTLTLNGGGTLNGTTSRTTTNNGVATFTNLTVNAAGTNYSLTASVTSPALSVTGSTFTVNAAAATKLAFSTAPVATNTAGQILPSFVVQIRDAFNNNISTSDVPITMSLSTGTFASGTPTTNTLADGSATFSDLIMTNAGNNILTASATGLASTNRAITILPDVASNSLVFVQGPPSSVNAGSTFTNTVKIADEFNNGISNATVTLNLNGAATLNGTLVRTTSGSGIATFTNLSVNTPGTGYSITATSGSLNSTSTVFDVTVGPIHHYVVSASSPQARGSSFNVTVTAQDVVSNTVATDNSTLVTMSSSSPTVLFDGTEDNSFTNSTHVLSNGTFSINALDNVAETMVMTATDTNGKTGSSSNIVVNAAAGDFRSAATGPWNATNTWQVWDGASWVGASTTPAGGAGTNITIQSTHTVTNNVAVGLTGVILNQGTLNFSGSGAITVGSGGIVLNSGAVNSSATTLILNSGATYDHARNGGTIPTAAYNSNSLLRVSGITSTIATLPTTGLNGNLEWNCPTQTVATAIILAVSGGGTQTIGGDFTVVTTGTGSIIGGGTTARSLRVGGNMTVRGGTYFAIGGNGSSAGNVSVNVVRNLTVSGGNLSMVVGEGTTSTFNASGVLTVGGNLNISSGTLTILTGTTYASSGISSMTVSGNTSIAGGTLNLTDATSGNANGVTANLKGDLTISSGTIRRAGTLPANVNFNGTSPQAYSKLGGTISGVVNFAIASGATVNFGTSLLDGSTGTFTLSSSGTIGIGDPLGITASGATGNIRVSGTRTYGIGGSYVYNGPASQATGNGLPSTVNSLSVSNTGGIVTLGSSVTVSNNLTVSAGAFDLGSFTANRATSGGTITVANGAALKIGGTSFPSNYTTRNLGATSTVEYEGAAQNVTALTYGNLVTSGSNTKTLQPGTTSIAGDLTIGSGTTFDAGNNNFSLAGNWINDGTGFTSSGSQTVTFNGSSVQNVGGAAATAFNSLAISGGSVLDLASVNSANSLSIAGANKAAGTWGASGSGATRIDDVHFQGTSGTLNVSTGPTSATTLGSSSNPAPFNSPVTLTATVVGIGGTPPPTGTVTFMEGVSTLDTATLSGSPTGTAVFITSSLSPGLHNITAVYSGDSGFAGSTSANLAQQINGSPLTITANSTNKTYGQTITFAGTEFTVVGLQGGDSVTSVTLTSDGAPANATVGSHTILVSNAVGSGLENYTIVYQDGTLTVGTASVAGSVTVGDKVYDGTNTATITSHALIGALGGDDVQLTGGTATFDTKNVGSNKTVTIINLGLGGTAAGNYVLVSSTVVTNASITPAPLTVTADNKARPFGAENPALTVSYATFVSGDDTNNALSGAPDVSTTAVTNSPLGTYPINVSTGNLSAVNYTLSFGNGTLTVGTTNLTVTADDKTRPYGTTNPVLTVTYSGFVGSDDTNILTGAPDISTAADTNSTVAGSPYDIIVTNGTLSATNYYNFVFVNGKLTVSPAVITVTADNKTKVYGDPVPPLTASYSGFVNDETTNVFSGAPALSTSAVSNSPVAGSPYPITVTSNTLSAANYTFTFNDGTLTVTAAQVTGRVTVSDKPYDATTTAAISSYALSGAIGDDDVGLTGGTANFDNANVGNNKVVTITGLTLGGSTASSYSLISDTVTTNASIVAASVTGSVTASNKVYDGSTTAVISSSGLSGVISNDDVTLIVGAADFIDKDVGNGKLVNANLPGLTGAAAGNYTLSSSSASTTASITAAPLEISADNKAKTQGLPNPQLTASYVGFVNAEGTNVLTTLPSLGTTANDTSSAGTYPITVSGAVAPNYMISYLNGTLTVVAVPQVQVKIASGNILLTFETLSNQNYQVQYKDNLQDSSWTALGAPIAGTGSSVTSTNSISGLHRFFNVDITLGN